MRVESVIRLATVLAAFPIALLVAGGAYAATTALGFSDGVAIVTGILLGTFALVTVVGLSAHYLLDDADDGRAEYAPDQGP